MALNLTKIRNCTKIDRTFFLDIDDEVTEWMDFVFRICFTIPMDTLGIILNIICILVLQRLKTSIRSTTLVLQALALVDLSFLIMSMVTWALPAVYLHTHLFENFYHNFLMPWFKGICFIFGGTRTATRWMVTLVTCHRYFALSKPLTARARLTTKTVSAIILIVIVYSFFFEIPIIFKIEYGTWLNCATNKTYWGPHLIRQHRHHVGRNAIYFILQSVVNNIIPIIIVFVLNISLIRRLRESNTRMKAMSRSEKKSVDTTLIFAALATAFLICIAPDAILRIIYVVDTFITNIIHTDHIHRFLLVSGFLVDFNSCVNIFVYYFAGSQFRKVLKDLISCRKWNEDVSSMNQEQGIRGYQKQNVHLNRKDDLKITNVKR